MLRKLGIAAIILAVLGFGLVGLAQSAPDGSAAYPAHALRVPTECPECFWQYDVCTANCFIQYGDEEWCRQLCFNTVYLPCCASCRGICPNVVRPFVLRLPGVRWEVV
jgi:hypothetical protein